MARLPSITYWNRVEPSPRGDSLQRGLEATVRDPLWLLARQWQLGEFQGEDAASPAFANVGTRTTRLDSWGPGNGELRPYDGSTPLEPLSHNEATTPDLRTAVELGQALEARLTREGAGPAVLAAFRTTWPVPGPADLDPEGRHDRALVDFLRVCGGRTVHGIDSLRAATAAAPGLPAELDLPHDARVAARAALAWLIDWAAATWGPIGLTDAEGWRPDRLEYDLEVGAPTPDGERVRLRGHAGPFGELDWYAFDQTMREPGDAPGVTEAVASLLPAPVRFAGRPNPRWWHFEDARFNWAAIGTERRELGKVLVVDFMLVQGNDWFVVPLGQEVGTLARVDRLLVRDVFGEWTLVPRADGGSGAGPGGRARWTLFSTTTADDGVADWFLLPPGALRATFDGPDVEEVRFVRDEQANLVWAVEATTESAAGRPWLGRERALGVPEETPPPLPASVPLRYRLQTTVPVNWIPFLPVQVDAARRAVALERAAMRRVVDGAAQLIEPGGRVLRPTGLEDPDVYRVHEEEVSRGGTRVLRADRRARWTTAPPTCGPHAGRRAGTGEAASGLRYDIAERTDQPG